MIGSTGPLVEGSGWASRLRSFLVVIAGATGGPGRSPWTDSGTASCPFLGVVYISTSLGTTFSGPCLGPSPGGLGYVCRIPFPCLSNGHLDRALVTRAVHFGPAVLLDSRCGAPYPDGISCGHYHHEPVSSMSVAGRRSMPFSIPRGGDKAVCLLSCRSHSLEPLSPHCRNV
jgi:hypothetical protein